MFESIAQALTGFLRTNNNPLGLLLLGVSALVEYIFPPFPGDTVTLFGAFLVTQYDWSLPWVFVSVLAGSGVGAVLDYYIGVWMGGRYEAGTFLTKPSRRRSVERVLRSFRRHGEAYVALNRFLPAVRAVFFLAAGMARLRLARVVFFALLSAAAWNALILAVGYAVGSNWDRLQQIFRTYSVVAWTVVGLIVAALVVRWIVRRRRGDADDAPDDPPPAGGPPGPSCG